MYTERNKFLTEVMGLCYHDFVKVHGTDRWNERSANDTLDFACSKCPEYVESVEYIDHTGWAKPSPAYYDFPDYLFINFSMWSGFGQLWEWCQKQEWFEEMLEKNCKSRLAFFNMIDPDRLADAVYEYLKGLDK